MKLGFIAHKVHRHGGMERAAAEVLERVAKKHDVIVVARECELVAPRITWQPVNPIQQPYTLLAWSFARRARRLEPGLGCTITNAIGASAIDADVITAQFCHAAFQHHYQGLRGGESWGRRRYHAWAGRFFTRQEITAYTSPRLKRVIAVSEGIKRELIHFYQLSEDKIVVIPNAVDHSIFKPAQDEAAKQQLRNDLGIPQSSFVCLFVGGDWERKGLSDAIQAISDIPDAVLVVVGQGNTERYRGLAETYGVRERLILAGRSTRPQDYYAMADVFVFPSRYEAFSLVTIEAAACGLPIIALRINGTEDLIEDGHNGFFVEPSPLEIREKILLLKQDRSLRVSMSRAALEVSKRYTWDRVASEQMEVFEGVAGCQ